MRRNLILAFLALSFGIMAPARGEDIFIRINQVGYDTNATKVAVAFSKSPLPADFLLEDGGNRVIFKGHGKVIDDATWGQFPYHSELDFSAVHSAGRFRLKIGQAESLPIRITRQPYADLPDELLQFMHEQRCGFNPWVDAKCHQDDGRTAYGPRPYGTKIDVTGGWHDAGDMLKYLMTSEDATAQMLLAYEVDRPHLSADRFNSLGQPGSNGIPDILDEAHWGLEWMLKMHPSPKELYHQVGDDRDHAGWRLPQDDQVDYGWGKGGARVAYCADGGPQGLKKYKSDSTGVANIAGVYAAAMGLAFEIWKDDRAQMDFAKKCLKAGEEVYALGRKKPGVQQGNSYGAPYRYSPTIWAGDMEWGAVELFRATGKHHYLDEAKRYAGVAADETWMGKEQTAHYQFFPFVNLGHYRLYDLVDGKLQKQLIGDYEDGINKCIQAGEKNPYRIGVPFIWCSNNLVVALATECLLEKRMQGGHVNDDFAAKQRDWLLGRNPWGTSMFTEIGEVYPRDEHLMTVQLLKRPVRGGLADGPVYARIFESLKGVSIREPDPLAEFQGAAVYHDDVHDYSSNEPTLDGTASATLMFALWDAGEN